MMSDAEFDMCDVATAQFHADTERMTGSAIPTLRDEARRLREIVKNAPHGALCKRGFKNLYDPGGKCICWKKDA